MSGEENQFNVQGFNIVTILKRLETATSRLEDITVFQTEHQKNKASQAFVDSIENDDEGKSIQAIEDAEMPREKSASYKEYEKFIEDNVEPFKAKSDAIDPLVGEAALLLQNAFQEQLKFLDIVSQAKRPDMSDPALVEALKPINGNIVKINKLKDENRSSPFFNHLNTISEGAPVLGWVVNPTPVSYIPEFKDSAQFWSNRIMKEYRDKDPAHVEWVKSFLSLFDQLKSYVKEFHATGPSWNPQGKELKDVLKSTLTSEPASRGSGSVSAPAPPPPPPPPPAADLFDNSTQSLSKGGSTEGMGAVFADLNKGEGITSGLKKVEKSQMTHKNPALRKTSTVSKRPPPPKKPSSLSSAPQAVKKKPASKELIDGTKWIIENYTAKDATSPIEIEAEMHQSIFIGHCEDITILIKGKANAVSVTETKKVALVIESLVSGLDLIKSDKFGLQITGRVPMVNIDKCNEGSLYLSTESIESDIQIFTSCSTSVNINAPQNEDYVELAVPEQFKHSVKNGKLVTEVMEHAG